MFHFIAARLHVFILGLFDRLRAAPQTGQGTVEYVALILLVAVVLGAAVKASGQSNFDLHSLIINKLKGAISTVGGGK